MSWVELNLLLILSANARLKTVCRLEHSVMGLEVQNTRAFLFQLLLLLSGLGVQVVSAGLASACISRHAQLETFCSFALPASLLTP